MAELPDTGLLDDVVAPRVLDAMRSASRLLDNAGIRHALCGGLAVGAHGHPRATKDVDFLVGDEAFILHPGGIVTMASGVPIQIAGVAVDHLSIKTGETFLAEALEVAVRSHDVPVLSAAALVYMKLVSPRQKDRVDVLSLVQAGLDIRRVEDWLSLHAPRLLSKWQGVLADALAEE